MDISQLVSTLFLSVLAAGFGWLILRRIDRFEAGVNRRFELVPTREEMNARFDGADNRFDGADNRFGGIDSRIERLESEVAAMRSDLTQIALALGARTRPQTG